MSIEFIDPFQSWKQFQVSAAEFIGRVNPTCGRWDVAPAGCGSGVAVFQVIDIFEPTGNPDWPGWDGLAGATLTGRTSGKVVTLSGGQREPAGDWFWCLVDDGLGVAYVNGTWVTIFYATGTCDPCSCWGWTPGEDVTVEI